MTRDSERLTCADCRFWDELPRGSGLCRRYAPRPVQEAAVMDSETQLFNANIVFPVVGSDDWCGELLPLPQSEEHHQS